jgi:hypothetical protein
MRGWGVWGGGDREVGERHDTRGEAVLHAPRVIAMKRLYLSPAGFRAYRLQEDIGCSKYRISIVGAERLFEKKRACRARAHRFDCTLVAHMNLYTNVQSVCPLSDESLREV